MDVAPERSRAGRWIWLFPAATAVHVAEEALLGATFPAWISRVAGVDLSMPEFLAMNAAALAAVAVGAALARRPGGAWAEAALGTAVLANALFHAAGSAATASLSPGLVTSALLWLPLGAAAVAGSARRARRRELVLGVLAGLAAHGVVLLSLVFA